MEKNKKIGEQPRYVAIRQYEREFKKSYASYLGKALEAVVKKMKKQVEKPK